MMTPRRSPGATGWSGRCVPPGADVARTDMHTLLLTRRLGGSKQVAGLADSGAGVVFDLTQDWIDALFPVTFGRDSTPDLPAIPTPKTPEAPAKSSGAAPVALAK